MKIQVFGSSSAGNCIRVYTEDHPGIYLDAGVNPREILAYGAPLANRQFLITHEHGDHAMYAKELAQNYGCRFYGTEGTLSAIQLPKRQSIQVKSPSMYQFSYDPAIYVSCFPVIHYPAADPVGWIIEIGIEKLLYMVDLGQLPAWEIPACDVYIIEANYTPDKLAKNVESEEVATPVAGRTISGFGHIGLEKTIEFIEPRLDHAELIILAHTSHQNFDFDEAIRMMPADMTSRTQIAIPGLKISTTPF